MKVRVVWKSDGWLGRNRMADADAPPQALVDLRSQILWGLNEGPRDIHESLALLKVAAEHGTADIVATPRASFENPLDPTIVAQRVEELRALCNGSIRIHTGCDVHFGPANIRDALANPHKYTINGQNYLTVEFPDVMVPPAAEDILGKFRTKAIVPIISHPERNQILQRSHERLKSWISMGCIIQVTARSLSGHFGKIAQRCAWDLLRAGMVHVIASDGRDLLHHPPRLDGAWRLVKQELGEDVAGRLLIEAPSAILRGAELGRKLAVPVAFPRPAAGDGGT